MPSCTLQPLPAPPARARRFAACPANAAESVKAVCDYVSDADEIYGVTDIFRRFFL